MTTKIPKSGYIGPLRVHGIPIHIHWTFPVGGLVVAFFLGDVSWKTAIPVVVAYTILILIHELGHAFGAKVTSSKVYAVLVTGAGGWCFAEESNSFWSRFVFYAGGIAAQMLALLVTVALVALFGETDSLVLDAFILVFTGVNVFLIVVNIIPTEGTDGQKLWDLLKERLG